MSLKGSRQPAIAPGTPGGAFDETIVIRKFRNSVFIQLAPESALSWFWQSPAFNIPPSIA
jgi:hypothetical protein